MGEEELSGAGFPLIDKIQTLAEWAPMLARLQAISEAKTPHDRALAIVHALQWAAGKTGTEIDDEALSHIESLLETPEGKAAFDWVVAKATGG
jgi:hypothetical protein